MIVRIYSPTPWKCWRCKKPTELPYCPKCDDMLSGMVNDDLVRIVQTVYRETSGGEREFLGEEFDRIWLKRTEFLKREETINNIKEKLI